MGSGIEVSGVFEFVGYWEGWVGREIKIPCSS